MKIKSVQIQGVGALADKTIEFALEGMTLVLGANERGKSTLCRALMATIYGFQLPVRWEDLRPEGEDQVSQGQVEFITDSGQLIITRAFEDNQARIVRLREGVVEGLFEGPANPRGRTEVIETYRTLLSETLGFPGYDTWLSSTYIGQLAVEIKLDRELRKLISGAGQADYKATLDMIRSQYYELTRAPLEGERKRSSDKEIEQLQQEIDEIFSRLQKAQSAQNEIADQHAQREARTGELIEADSKIRNLKNEIQDLADYLQYAQRYQELLAQEEIQAGQEKRVGLLEAEIEDLREKLASERFVRISELTDEGRAALKRYVHSDAEQNLARIQTMHAEEARLQGELSSAVNAAFASGPEDSGARLSELKELETKRQQAEAQLTAAQASADTPSSRAVWLVPLALFLLAGVVGAFIGASLAPSLPFAPAISILAGALLLAFPAGLVGMLISLWLRRQPQAKAPGVIAAEARLEQAETDLSSARDSLNASIRLDQQDASLDLLIERWNVYTNNRKLLADQQEKRKVLEEQESLKLRDRPDLAPILEQNSSALIKERLDEFESMKMQLAARAETLADIRRQESSGSAVATGHNRKDILARMDTITTRRPTFLVYKEDHASGSRLLEEKRQELSTFETRRERIAGEIQTMQVSTARSEGALRDDPVLLAEALEDKRARLDRQKLQAEALRTAYGILTEVISGYEETYFDLLAERASEYFRLFTRGAYTACRIGSGEAISVESTSGQVFVQTQLSSGTLDQLYLSVRLAISDTIGSVEKMPILLDDTFVNFDRARLQATLEVLEEIAKERQVILLSHEERLRDMGFKVINL